MAEDQRVRDVRRAEGGVAGAGEWFEPPAASEEDMAGMEGATGAVAKAARRGAARAHRGRERGARPVRRGERGTHGGCREGVA